MIRILFSILLGVLLALFVGLGIEAFYPTEKYPEPPIELQFQKSQPSQSDLDKQQAYENQIKEYRTRNETHSRNVSIIAIGASIILMALSLTILQKLSAVFADGFLLGSIFTLLYGIIRGFETSDNKFRFIIVSVGLIITFVLGYIKFIAKEKK